MCSRRRERGNYRSTDINSLLSICLFIYLSIWFIYLSIYPSIHLSIYPSLIWRPITLLSTSVSPPPVVALTVNNASEKHLRHQNMKRWWKMMNGIYSIYSSLFVFIRLYSSLFYIYFNFVSILSIHALHSSLFVSILSILSIRNLNIHIHNAYVYTPNSFAVPNVSIIIVYLLL